jgi:DNA repair exonuclease SbcCD ATPase subunit
LAAGLACVGVAALAIAFAGWRTRPAAVDDGPRQRDLAERAALGRDFEELRSRMEEAAASRLPAPELAARAARLAQLPGLIQESGGAALRAELEAAALEREAEWLAEAEDAAGVAEREAARLKRRAAALELARHELAGAIDDVRAAVAPRVAELAGERLIQVASHWAVELDPRAALGFRAVRRDGGPPRALSDGTADQFHFAVRLALADALLGELRPPLLLDDPFRYADAERRSALHALLVEIATTRQVLYFTVEAPGDLPLTHRLPGLQVSV